jgi:hypothetical protein
VVVDVEFRLGDNLMVPRRGVGKDRSQREERRSVQALQKRKNVRFVLHPFPADVGADLQRADAPAAQQTALIFADVLIEQVH